MQIEFDENDIKSVSCAIEKLHKMRTRLSKDHPEDRVSNIRFELRMKSIEKEYNAIKLIESTDLSSVYGNDGPADFYVYAHCNSKAVLRIKDDPRHLYAAELGLTCVPFYIGKGRGDRAFDTNRNEGHRKIKQFLEGSGGEIKIVKLRENLTDGESLALESKLIDIFGLKALSSFTLLTNVDEGSFKNERRALYPKGVPWYLNRIKLKPYSVPKG